MMTSEEAGKVVVAAAVTPWTFTKTEIGWAKHIKEMIIAEEEEEVVVDVGNNNNNNSNNDSNNDDDDRIVIRATDFTDLEYAQIAMITKGKFDRAKKMIHNVSKFKREHGIESDGSIAVDDISNIVDKAMESIQRFEKKSPGFLLSFGRKEEKEEEEQKQAKGENGTAEETNKNNVSSSASAAAAVIAFNLTAFNPRKYGESEEEWKIMFTAMYYLLEASSSTVSDIRSGLSVLCDCDLIGYYENYSTEIHKNGSSLYEDSYPIRLKNVTCLNTPMIFRMVYSIFYRPFLSVHTTNVLTMNGTFESDIEDRYDPKILPKSLNGKLGTWELKNNLRNALRLRYETKATFTL